MYDFKGKIVLITGASSGIGKGCAEAFAKEKAFLAISGRNSEALDATKKKCCEIGLNEDNVLTVIGDLSKEEDVKELVKKVIEKYGKLDILVNSAGILVSGSTESLQMEAYDTQMNINTRSPLLLSKLCLPYLLESKGNIVNVSSVAGIRAFPNVVAYNMSKAALDQFTRTLALEVAGQGVRVNSVNPGVIVTDIHKRGGMDDEAYKKFLEHGKTTHAMGRVGTTSEVASVILFLASDAASFVTGTTIPVDGGRSIMCPR